MAKALIDKGLGKLVSRKLMAFATATALLVMDKVTSESWVEITMVYIGSQAAVDLVTKLRGNSGE